MFQSIKNLFGHTPPAQKMAGAAFTIMGPLPGAGDVYTLKRAIQTLNLKGWMRLANRINIELEVHGTFQAISELLQQIDHGTLLQRRVKYEMMWLPYQSKFAVFSLNIFERQAARPR